MYEIVISTSEPKFQAVWGPKTPSYGIQVSYYTVEKAKFTSSVTQEGLVCPIETKRLLH